MEKEILSDEILNGEYLKLKSLNFELQLFYNLTIYFPLKEAYLNKYASKKYMRKKPSLIKNEIYYYVA